MDDEEKRKIEEGLKKESRNGALSCRAALGLAERLNADPRMVGQVADELHIKIASCQLGCF